MQLLPGIQRKHSNFANFTPQIQFIEDNWHIGTSTGPPPTYHQFIRVLLNLTELSFSAQYTEVIDTYQLLASLVCALLIMNIHNNIHRISLNLFTLLTYPWNLSCLLSRF